ncbi:hypothetical protein Tco_1410488 [Tanacetum coccineum]
MANLPPPNHDANLPEDEADPEEEPIPEQALATLVGFAPQWIGGQILNNNHRWLEEDDEEDPEEDDDEDPEEDEEDEDDEVEFQKKMMRIQKKMSPSSRALLDGNSVVFAAGPKPSDLMTIHSITTKLEKQMFERYKTEIKTKEKFKEDDLRMNRHELDVTTKYSKMKRLMEGVLYTRRGYDFKREPPITHLLHHGAVIRMLWLEMLLWAARSGMDDDDDG